MVAVWPVKRLARAAHRYRISSCTNSGIYDALARLLIGGLAAAAVWLL
jgi:hypothetical protein